MFIKGTILLLFVLFCTGCYLTETKVSETTGQEITKMEEITTQAQGYIEPIAPIVNTFVPGSGIIIGGVALLLGLIGTTTTALVSSYKKGGALAAVIQGVGIANDAETKATIKAISKDTGLYDYLHKLVKRYDPLSKKKETPVS